MKAIHWRGVAIIACGLGCFVCPILIIPFVLMTMERPQVKS